MYLIRVKFKGESWADGLVLVYDDRKEWEKSVRAVTKGVLDGVPTLDLKDTQGHMALIDRDGVQSVVFVDFEEEIGGAERTARFKAGRDARGLVAEAVRPEAPVSQRRN